MTWKANTQGNKQKEIFELNHSRNQGFNIKLFDTTEKQKNE